MARTGSAAEIIAASLSLRRGATDVSARRPWRARPLPIWCGAWRMATMGSRARVSRLARPRWITRRPVAFQRDDRAGPAQEYTTQVAQRGTGFADAPHRYLRGTRQRLGQSGV